MTILQYLLKFSISLSVLYLFYQLALRRLTFYNWNRWFLLGYSLLSFIIPFINISFILESGELQHSKFIGLIPVMEQIAGDKAPLQAATHKIDLQLIYLLVIVVGAAIVAGRLLLQYYSLQRLRQQGTILHDEKIKLLHIDKNILPFSFGNTIYVNKYLHTEEELKEIIHHEFIHVRQQHSVDILWSEWLCIINWFNPFAWLLRKAIRQNLEFIADHKVLENGINRKQYQYLLLKVTGASQFSIANNFNFSSLKNRIAMMNSVKSARLHLVKFLFLLPLIIVLLVSFRQSQNRHSQHKTTTVASAQLTDTVPPPPPPPPNPPKKVDVKVKTPPPPPPKDPKMSEMNIISDDSDGTHAVIIPDRVVKTVTTVKSNAKIDTKIEAVRSIKADVQNVSIGKVEVLSDLKPMTSISMDVKPITSVMTADVMEVTKGGGEEVLVLKNTTTKQELEQMKKDLESKGYEFTIKDVSYSDDKVVSIKGTIRKGNDWGSFESAHFQKFVISYVTGKDSRFLVSILHGSIVFTNSAE